MHNYLFLTEFINQLDSEKQVEYILKPGILPSKLPTQAQTIDLVLPTELTNFYKFSYGSILDEYEILTIPKILNSLRELSSTYEEDWNGNLVPFAYVLGVGDWLLFDLQDHNSDGFAILDGFHEFPPHKWEKICYGLHNFLEQMCLYDFKPFWLS